MSESTETESESIESSDSPGRRTFGSVCLLFSAALWLATTVCYIIDWDGVAALTVFPDWAWALLGGSAGYLAWRFRGEAGFVILPLLWILTTFCFSDNVVSMLRLLKSVPKDLPRMLRVVTFNCAGSAAAAGEISILKPDIVLLQEIPQSADLERLAREWFGDAGSYVCGTDCAILARGKLRKTGDRLPVQHMQAVLELPSDDKLLVTSVRFLPPEGRWKLWTRKTWEMTTDNRRQRRHQLKTALERTDSQSKLPEIFGGDFNAPAGDAVFRLLTNFEDAHRQAGIGWGNTALNKFPIARPDEIWLKDLNAVSVRAFRTQNSDHRIVCADVQLVH